MENSILLCYDLRSDRPNFIQFGLSDPISFTEYILEKPQPICLWQKGFISNKKALEKSVTIDRLTTNEDILVSGYKSFGENLSKSIDGTISYIIWDGSNELLLVSRDRIGSVGFYYHLDGTDLFLSDQVDVLLRAIDKKIALNTNSIIRYIHGFPPLLDETFYINIKALEPGNSLIVRQNHLTKYTYWKIESKPTLKLKTDREYADAFRELLFQVVSEYLPSDTCGITLSSGLDSTCVAAAAANFLNGSKINAFTWITPDIPDADEGDLALEIANFLNIPIRTIRADLHLPFSHPNGIVTQIASPYFGLFTDSWSNTYRILSEVKIKTLFTGVSGDHLFGGNVYSYPDLLFSGHWLQLISELKKHLPKSEIGLKNIIKYMIFLPILQAYLPLKRFREITPHPWVRSAHHQYLNIKEGSTTPFWLSPGRKQRLSILQDPSLTYFVEEMNKHAFKFGIELRHPLIDRRIIEFAASLPTSQSFQASKRKIIMRNAMIGFLPPNIINKDTKTYPSSIAQKGVREFGQQKIWPLMNKMKAEELGIVDERLLQNAYKDYINGKTQKTAFLWTIILEDWLRRYH